MTKQHQIGAKMARLSSNPILSADFDAAHIWSRPGLDLRYRHLTVLTAAMVLDQMSDLPDLIEAALADGLTPDAIVETFIHNMLYGGSIAMQKAIDEAMAVFARQGLAVTIRPLAQTVGEPESKAGAEMKTRLHGDRKDLGHADPDARFANALYSLATDFGYGHIWCRAGLSIKDRLVCAVAAFTVLADAEPSFRKFSQSAYDNGCSTLEIQEVVVQTVPYIGFPRALKALMLMEETFAS